MGRLVNSLVPALALTLAACTPPSTTLPVVPVPPVEATVVHVTDGDTITLLGGEKVRLLGIDSPEVVKPHSPVMCGGPESSAWAKQLLDGQRVTLVADPTQADRDRYGRLLRYIRLADGRDFSIESARAGMSRSYVYAHRPVQEAPEIEAAEREAQAAHRGLWASC